MIVLLNELSEQNTELIDYFSRQEEVSTYLSISRADILRIIRDIKPDVVIMGNSKHRSVDFVRDLCKHNPNSTFFTYYKGVFHAGEIELEDSSNRSRITLNAIVRRYASGHPANKKKL